MPPQQPRPGRGLRVLAWLSAVVIALGALYGIEVFVHRTSGEERQLLAAAVGESRVAGCSPVRAVTPYPRGLDRAHIGVNVGRMPPLSTYPSVPPASGPHAPVPLDAGVYRRPPPLDQAIHSLEHAAVIVWLAPSASGREVDRIRDFFARGGERNHVIVAPYDYPSGGTEGHLRPGEQMALVAWHRLQSCARPSLAVAYAFVHRFRFDLWQPTAYEGVAPEKLSPI